MEVRLLLSRIEADSACLGVRRPARDREIAHKNVLPHRTDSPAAVFFVSEGPSAVLGSAHVSPQSAGCARSRLAARKQRENACESI